MGETMEDINQINELNQNEIYIVEATKNYVFEQLKDDTSGHDWWHIHRVVSNTIKLARLEKTANMFICVMAALLHDVIDDKLVEDEVEAVEAVKQFMTEQSVATEEQASILSIICHMSFKGGQQAPLSTIEGFVVQDADRLDAIGAIGIARTIYYSGYKGRPIHDPDLKPRENMSLEEYRNGKDTAILHFYEKLLKLKDLMNTESGRQIAEGRHAYLVGYLEQFYAEWDAER